MLAYFILIAQWIYSSSSSLKQAHWKKWKGLYSNNMDKIHT